MLEGVLFQVIMAHPGTDWADENFFNSESDEGSRMIRTHPPKGKRLERVPRRDSVQMFFLSKRAWFQVLC